MSKLLHTMLRVGDLKRSVHFYTQLLGMTLIRQSENTEYKYTLAFLGYANEVGGHEIELTYNWDTTEYDLGTAYGHIAIGVDDIHASCDAIAQSGGKVVRKPGPVAGGTTVIAFIEDPDGYKIELIESQSSHKGLG